MSKLTLKQQRFITAYLKTGSGSQAAREAGYKGNPQTLAQVAHENLMKPDIQEALTMPLQREERLQERVITEVRNIALQAHEGPLTATHKLRALELMAKMLGLYDDAPKVQVNGYFDIKSASAQELQAKLAELEEQKEKDGN